MASQALAIKNSSGGFIFYVNLQDMSGNGSFKANPTLAAGDVKVSIDGGALANLGTLPTVTPASGVWVKVTLAQAEINGDNIQVQFIDQTSPKEWCDLGINIKTVARQFDDFTFPNVSGRGMDVDASGGVEVGSFQAGAITSAAFAAGAIDASAIATDAIGSAELATTAVNEIRDAILSDSTSFAGGSIAAIKAITDLLVNLTKTGQSIGRGTATSGGSTTSIPTSAMTPAGAVADQFKGRVVLFDWNTTTTTLRGVAVAITASSNAATPTFTVDTMPAAPASGDTFSVI